MVIAIWSCPKPRDNLLMFLRIKYNFPRILRSAALSLKMAANRRQEITDAMNSDEDESNEFEGDDTMGDEADYSSDMEDDEGNEEARENDTEDMCRVYLPGRTGGASSGDAAADGQELEFDESAYVMYHHVQTVYPCLSFDVIRDDLGENRADKFPLTAYILAGTQSDSTERNDLLLMHLENLTKLKKKEHSDDSDDSDSDSSDSDADDPALMPKLASLPITHRGCINRVRTTDLHGHPVAASWSELGTVYLWDLIRPLRIVGDHNLLARQASRNSDSDSIQPIFSFPGHLTEGYAMDWSPMKPGVLATGDCNKNIHVWKPQDGGSWHVNQQPYAAHTASVEDLQWSPNEACVLASCSVDKTIRIWDTRASGSKACMLTASEAHEMDVNVISWNRLEPLLLSGGDDGAIKVWDLRQFKSGKPLAAFKHHTAPITSVEWHPTDSSVFAASGSDEQVSLWDLALERDPEGEGDGEEEPELADLPPQLLFIHQGQKDIKELHWHPQMPGVLITTAFNGFNVFRTISV